MFKLSDIRIGTKLFMMSGLGVLLVVGMIVTQMHGNSVVKSANEAATLQQHLSHDILATKVVARGIDGPIEWVRDGMLEVTIFVPYSYDVLPASFTSYTRASE